MHFLMRAKALVAFPGGFGTLDELFEVLTLVQTRKAKPVPILLFGTAYWKRLINFDVLVEEGTISPQDLDLFEYVDDPDQAWESIQRFYNLPDCKSLRSGAPKTQVRRSGTTSRGTGALECTLRCKAACAIRLADTGAVTNTNSVINISAMPGRPWVKPNNMDATSTLPTPRVDDLVGACRRM
jgi:hypothetical protein